MTKSTPPTSDQTGDFVPSEVTPNKRGAPLSNTNACHHGAPFGNNNAVKHGFYSSAFTRAERKRLDEEVQGELNDEEECIRLVIRRFIDSMGDEKMYYKYLLAIRAICLAFGRIESLHRTRRVIYDKQTTLDQVWEELKLIPPEED